MKKAHSIPLYFKSAIIIFVVSACLISSCYAAAIDYALQWDHSVDYPYLGSYKVYYYTEPGDKNSLNVDDYADSYTVPGKVPITITSSDPGPITIDKSYTQITLHFSNDNKTYYFAVSAVDTRGVEGNPTPEISIFKLAVLKDGTGTGTVTSLSLRINCGLNCSAGFAEETIVSLAASPDANNAFIGWSGGICSGTGSCVVTMDSAKSVTAEFQPVRTLTINKEGNGTGTFSSDKQWYNSDINCGNPSCLPDYIYNTTVTLTAVPDPGNAFIGWSGGICSGTGSCVVTMDSAESVTAEFQPVRTLTINKEGNGTGTFSSDKQWYNSDINCGNPSCLPDYIYNTTVTLTAVPDPGNVFLGWSGGICSGTGSCVVTMDSAKSVTAEFAHFFTLTINKEGNGTGTFSSDKQWYNSDINCGNPSCLPDYIYNTTVTLTAVPDPGNVFIGWSGGICSGTGSCVVTMDSAKSVTATFLIIGDINSDGDVTLADAILILQLMSRGYPAGVQKFTGVNNEGKLGPEDAVYILQIVAALR